MACDDFQFDGAKSSNLFMSNMEPERSTTTMHSIMLQCDAFAKWFSVVLKEETGMKMIIVFL